MNTQFPGADLIRSAPREDSEAMLTPGVLSETVSEEDVPLQPAGPISCQGSLLVLEASVFLTTGGSVKIMGTVIPAIPAPQHVHTCELHQQHGAFNEHGLCTRYGPGSKEMRDREMLSTEHI